MPILKQLVSGSSQSKRRSRADLTPEMISAPLGDFRHTMHVGRGGDTFGDTSFLASRSGEPPRQPTDTLPPPPPQHQYQMSHPQHPSQPPPPPPDSSPPTQHHKPSLLSRTFRSSKRSQSVNRAADKHKSSSSIMVSSATPTMLLPGNGSPTHVKTAISLPYLNEGGGGGGGALSFPKSVSSSPLKRGMGSAGDVIDGRKPANGAAASAAALAIQEPDLLEAERERRFGDLSDLPPSLPRGGGGGGGMKHAESIMSFHIDLGPSMLGDILSVMDKPAAWDCDDSDLGFEDGRGSPPLSPPRAAGNGVGGGVDHRANGHDDVVGGGGGGGGGRGGGASSDDNEAPSPPAPSRPPRITSSSSTSTSTSSSSSRYASNNGGGAVVRPPGGQHLDSCSVSSSGSTVQDDRMSGSIGGHSNHGYSNQRNQLNHSNQSETDGDSARFSSPGRSTTREEDRDFSFMDDDDEDEIRV